MSGSKLSCGELINIAKKFESESSCCAIYGAIDEGDCCASNLGIYLTMR